MAHPGESPENPVHVVSIAMLDPTRELFLGGVRRLTGNEDRHDRMFSSLTRETTPRRFDSLLDSLVLEEPGELHIPNDPRNYVWLGYGQHGKREEIGDLDQVLGKAGLAEFLAAGLFRAAAVLRHVTLSHVGDSATEEFQWTKMAHYEATIQDEESLARVPKATLLYNPLIWVEARQIPDILDDKGKLHELHPELADILICTGGACMKGASFTLQTAFENPGLWTPPEPPISH